jgi:hypothetical protein
MLVEYSQNLSPARLGHVLSVQESGPAQVLMSFQLLSVLHLHHQMPAV